MLTCIELVKGSNNPRLEPHEAEALSNVFFRFHDHLARTPAVPVWWERAKYTNGVN